MSMTPGQAALVAEQRQASADLAAGLDRWLKAAAVADAVRARLRDCPHGTTSLCPCFSPAGR